VVARSSNDQINQTQKRTRTGGEKWSPLAISRSDGSEIEAGTTSHACAASLARSVCFRIRGELFGADAGTIGILEPRLQQHLVVTSARRFAQHEGLGWQHDDDASLSTRHRPQQVLPGTTLAAAALQPVTETGTALASNTTGAKRQASQRFKTRRRMRLITGTGFVLNAPIVEAHAAQVKFRRRAHGRISAMLAGIR